MTLRLRSGQVRRLYERFVPKNQRALARVFFGRLFENDFFSSSVAATSNLMFLLALVAVPGVIISGGQSFTWAHLRATARRLADPMIVDRALMGYQTFYIAVAMAVAFVVTMMVWSSLTPDRKDALVLGALPVSAREQARARLLSLLQFFGLFAVAVTVPTAVAFNFVSGAAETIRFLPQLILGHVVAAGLGAAFAFFLLLDVQLVCAALFGPRAIRFIALPLQLASIGAVIAALASAQDFGRALLGPVSDGMLWHPLAWFAGVYRWIGGDEREIFGTLAARGVAAGGIVIGFAVTIYPRAYERCLRNVITIDATPTRGVRALGATEWCLWALGDARRTLQLAGFLFGVWVVLRAWHLLRARKINTFTYDEQPPPLVTTMDIATQLKQI